MTELSQRSRQLHKNLRRHRFKMKVKLLETIEGFEDVAEYRIPKEGERFVRSCGRVFPTFNAHPKEELVLTPIKRWRKATIDDAVRAIEGENVEVRFSNNGVEWLSGYLHGYRKDTNYSWLSKTGNYTHCEVLDA